MAPHNPLAGFIHGFLSPFRALSYLRSNPGLLRYILIPFQINIIVFSLALYLGIHFFQSTVLAALPQGDAWYWVLLTYLLWLLAIAVTLVLVFFSFTVVGNLIAAPFNDILSERVEMLERGTTDDTPFSLGRFLADSRRIMVEEGKKTALFVAGMLLLLLLNSIPVLGTLLYSALSILWTIFFLMVDYTGYPLIRHRLNFAQQRHFIRRNLAPLTGFGCGLLALLAIPFLQFLCIPLGIIAATRICVRDKGLTATNGDQPGP